MTATVQATTNKAILTYAVSASHVFGGDDGIVPCAAQKEIGNLHNKLYKTLIYINDNVVIINIFDLPQLVKSKNESCQLMFFNI